jgi:hypothetical protein
MNRRVAPKACMPQKLVSHNVYVHIHKSILNCVLCKVYVPYTGRPRIRLEIRTHVYTVYVREREREIGQFQIQY